MGKNFVENFILSFLFFLLAGLIGYVAYALVMWMGLGLGSGVPLLLSGLVFTCIPAALFFFRSRNSILLGKQWLNYLSVSGSLIFGIIWGIFLSHGILGVITGLGIANTPFALLSYIITVNIFRSFSVSVVATCVIATFPSIITWLGMVYQARRNKRLGI